MNTTEVTERDFRMPEFWDAKPEDYERREDGRIVRKDRWETTVRAIATAIGVGAREGFECDVLLFWVKNLIQRAKAAGIEPHYDEELPQ